MNLNPFVELAVSLISFYKTLVIIWVILGLLISFGIVNKYQPIIHKIMNALNSITEPILSHLRKILPNVSGIDFSPVLLFFILEFLISILRQYFYVY